MIKQNLINVLFLNIFVFAYISSYSLVLAYFMLIFLFIVMLSYSDAMPVQCKKLNLPCFAHFKSPFLARCCIHEFL